jgi:2-(1,2-epoxy-1,2-dihydrophenyl)acetyl-CoA isomerase
MSYQTISCQKRGPVGILYLDRPEVLNALCFQMREELLDYLREAAGDEGLRVLILTGRGRAFSAGGDLTMFKNAYEAYRQGTPEQRFGRPDLPRAFVDFPKPIIAAINGPAVGFGLTVTLICDIRIASTMASFSCAFVRIGVTPEFCSSYFLPRLIGYGKAAELAFTAKTIDAQEAADMGLVNRVVEHEKLLAESEQIAETISKMPPEAVRMTKEILRHGYHSTLEQVIQYESLVFNDRTKSKEHYDAVCNTLEQIKNTRY